MPQNETAILKSYNPATGEVVGEVHSFSIAEAEQALARARAAQHAWAESGLEARLATMKRFEMVLVEHADELCRLISAENGKPLTEAMMTEVLPLIDLVSYFTKNAPRILRDHNIPLHLMKQRKSFITYRPRGVMLVISPWNFPFTIASGSVVMGLIAGNVILHKPASLTPLIAVKTRQLFDLAGLPAEVYQVLPGPGAMASHLIEKGVDYVNFTGSTGVGRQVAATCGRKLIPCSMELGGKDPLYVAEDADLEVAANSIVWGGLANSGQICASVERVYIHERVYDTVVEKVVAKARALRVGDPGKGDVDCGPMVDPAQLEIVERQVNAALAAGAKAVVGGKRLAGPGQFFEPTILTDVNEEMEVVFEETFGPVVPLLKVANDEEAIARCNHSPYGLTAYVFSGDKERAQRIARRLEAGTVMINDVLLTHGAPETPWQGAKESGTGKVHSDQGLRDLCFPYHINEDHLVAPSNNVYWYPYSQERYTQLLTVARGLFGDSGLGGRAKALCAFMDLRKSGK